MEKKAILNKKNEAVKLGAMFLVFSLLIKGWELFNEGMIGEAAGVFITAAAIFIGRDAVRQYIGPGLSILRHSQTALETVDENLESK